MQGMKKQIPNVFPFGAQTSVELVPLRSTHNASINGSALERREGGPDNRRRACAAVSLPTAALASCGSRCCTLLLSNPRSCVFGVGPLWLLMVMCPQI